MANKDIEIEVKFPLKNSEDVRSFLDKHGQKISEHIRQKDVYYTPIHRHFLKYQYPFEWLRLRTTSKGSFITYKHFHPENSHITNYCDEFETKIESIETMEKIFAAIDIKEVATIDKSRSTWVFENVEIVIDEVKELGVFMELEAKGHFDDAKVGKAHLYAVLEMLSADVGEEDLRGYPFKLLENKGYKFGEEK